MLCIVGQIAPYGSTDLTKLASWRYLARQRSDTCPMAKGNEKRTERFSMRLPASVHARLLGAANADHRSMADVAVIAIEKYLDALESPQVRKR
jgi:predicted HicB family RNase H-like nuclease